MENYYKILELDENASEVEIKKAFRRLSFMYHPDKNPSQVEKFKQINQAYEILKDPTSKAAYDFELSLKNPNPFPQFPSHEAFSNMNMGQPGGGLFENIFENLINMKQKKNMKKGQMAHNLDDIFQLFTVMEPGIDINGGAASMFMGPHFEGLHQRQKEEINDLDDIHCEHFITFDDSYFGCCVPIDIERTIVKGTKTKTEYEKIYLTIPKGVDYDEIITIKDKGNICNNKQSDVKVHIKVYSHDSYKRDGLNIILKKRLSFKESLCGFNFILEQLNGKQMKMTSSRGNIIQNGDKKVLKNLGFERNDKKGDLVIEFIVSHPDEKLTDEQLKLIEDIF